MLREQAIKIAKETAANVYKKMDGMEIYALGRAWNGAELKKLIEYDTLKICALVYLFSCSNERRVIEKGLSDFFGYYMPKRCVARVLDQIEIKNPFIDFFGSLPYAVALACPENSSEVPYAEALFGEFDMLTRAIVDSGKEGQLSISSVILLSTYFDRIRNILNLQGIDDLTVANHANIADNHLEHYYPSDGYLDIDFLDGDKARKIFDKFKDVLADGTLARVISESKKITQDINLSRNKVKEIIKFIDDVDPRFDVSKSVEDIHEYATRNEAVLQDMNNQYVQPVDNASTNSVESGIRQIKKLPADERMIEFINSSDDSDGQVDKLIGIYNDASESLKKGRAKKFNCWIWDFWLLHNSNISYRELSEEVKFNKWNIDGIKALQERRFADALPYIRTFYDPCSSIIAKRIDKGIIADSIIITLSCVDQICSSKGIDFIELLLGKFGTYDWLIYGTEENLKNNVEKPIVKNIGNVQIYHFNPQTGSAKVSRHSYCQEARDFLVFLLKRVDNYFRALLRKETLTNEFDMGQLSDVAGSVDVLSIFDETIATVTNNLLVYYKPICSEAVLDKDIPITDIPTREYSLERRKKINDVDEFINKEIRSYYGVVDETRTNAISFWNMFELDLDKFDIHSWTYRYHDRERIKQGQHQVSHRDGISEFPNLLKVINSKAVEYNPNFNFLFSGVLDEVDGLNHREHIALQEICEDATDFLQWIEWAKRGRFVYAKNGRYVQIFLQFILNDWILSDNRAACLLLMCEVWNHYYDEKQKLGSDSDLYLGWIKDYWILYCSDEINEEEFLSLFRYDISFFYVSVKNASEHFFVNMDKYNETHLLDFYNENCDYHVISGTLVKSGYSALLEKSLEAVHDALKKLWAEYGIEFLSYLHMECKTVDEKMRKIFDHSILTDSSKKRIVSAVNRVKISDTEKYICEYDYDNNWPVFRYTVTEVSNISSRLLMEYICKLTDKYIREWLELPYNFKFDEAGLFSAFPNDLFRDNLHEYTIETTIMKTVFGVCNNFGIETTNPKIVRAQHIMKAKEGAWEEDKYNAYNLGFVKNSALSQHAEYDLIERTQKVDSESIERARTIMAKNQERLVADDAPVGDSKYETKSAGLLTSDEKMLLKGLLDREDISEITNELKRRFVSIGMLIESINKKSIDEFGDSIIEDDDGPSIVKEYQSEARKLLEK